MSLLDIRNYVAPRIGATDVNNNPKLKIRVDALINQAAYEVYVETDLPGSLQECNIQVSADVTIALPQFIGPLKGIREIFTAVANIPSRTRPWQQQLLMPRYTSDNWDKRWTKFTYRGYSAIETSITNAGPVTATMQTPDNSVFYVLGSTINSNSTIDTITMNATSVVGSVNFSSIKSIHRHDTIIENITLKDLNGVELAVLYNNFRASIYQIFDISQFPNVGNLDNNERCLEILFKEPLPLLKDDNDAFVVPNYDIIIGKKAVQLYQELQPGQEQAAMLADKRITRDINRQKAEVEGNVKQQFQIEEEALFNLRDYTKFGYPYDNWSTGKF